jgi:hypothetical protein
MRYDTAVWQDDTAVWQDDSVANNSRLLMSYSRQIFNALQTMRCMANNACR